MEIIINGKQAYMKKNTSFEYISENSLFTGSDSYTLSITFPLKDCPENIAIFGHIHRKDVAKNKVLFDCEIRDKAFYKAGTITVTQITEVEVKTQFLEGRSEQNYDDSFDEVYINQLSLGYPENRMPSQNNIYDCWMNCYPWTNWVALPWVNNTSGNLQNAGTQTENGGWQWSNTRVALSYQPFLMYILDKICEVMGYTGNFSVLKNSQYKYLLICNTLPSAWGTTNFANALPHWSLTEFFEQLELFLGGEFAINHKAKTIEFQFSHVKAYNTNAVSIYNVVNKYTVEVSQEDKSDYIGTANKAYAENDNRMWAYKSCEWYIREHKNDAIVYNTLSELLAWAANQKECGYQRWETAHGYRESYTRGYPASSEAHKLFYAKDVDCYFIMWCYKAELIHTSHIYTTDTDYYYYKYTNRLMPVNQFGRKVIDKDADDVEINIVPAWIDYTDEELGQCLFLECGQMDAATVWTEETDGEGNTTGSSSGGTSSGGFSYGGTRSGSGNFGGSRVTSSGSNNADYDDTDYNSGALAQTNTGKAIAKGEKEKDDAYFDKLYVGFWDSANRDSGKLPHPCLDTIEIRDNFTFFYTPYTLRINTQRTIDSHGIPLKYTYAIDPKKKYTFSFLADEIPDPRALFYIEGQRYVCEKITATFHEETGKSQLLKFQGYRVEE
jgi:uncharacterized membrane protein YgcG